MKVRSPLAMLRRHARRGRPGFPVATIAFYGPDNKRASKVVLGVIAYEGAEPQLTKWMSATTDVRYDVTIAQAILERVREHGVRSVALADRIIGCPHETGVDYPEGQSCPQCPYWRGRNRWTGEYEPEQSG